LVWDPKQKDIRAWKESLKVVDMGTVRRQHTGTPNRSYTKNTLSWSRTLT